MNLRFKRAVTEYNHIISQFEDDKRLFIRDVENFFHKYRIPVKVLFFIDCFGIDINVNMNNVCEVPLSIPVKVLYEFCEEFGCDFKYTSCNGNRWIFSFDNLKMR